jgi:hypothetical protein
VRSDATAYGRNPADSRAEFIFAMNCDSIEAVLSAMATAGTTIAAPAVVIVVTAMAAKNRATVRRVTRSDTT